MYGHLLREFQLDWTLSGKAPRTVELYVRYLEGFLNGDWEASAADAKSWLLATGYQSVRRKRAQALRAFSKWCTQNGMTEFAWAYDIPLTVEKIAPQETVTYDIYLKAVKSLANARDRAVVELLWSCGLRRTELARLHVSDIDFSGSHVVIRHSKTRKPRIAPLSPAARSSLRRHLGRRTDGSLLNMTSNAIRLMLQRSGLPSSHAWRRGWAVHSLRAGVSEASVRAAAGWSSGAMVARYTNALSGELAMAEFTRVWSPEFR
jgi:integrase